MSLQLFLALAVEVGGEIEEEDGGRRRVEVGSSLGMEGNNAFLHSPAGVLLSYGSL